MTPSPPWRSASKQSFTFQRALHTFPFLDANLCSRVLAPRETGIKLLKLCVSRQIYSRSQHYNERSVQSVRLERQSHSLSLTEVKHPGENSSITVMRVAIARAIPSVWIFASLSVVAEGFKRRRPLSLGMHKTIAVPSLSLSRTQLLVRGGDADFSGDAQKLFGNVISPAAMLAGSLVPLGFLAPPLPGRKTIHKRLRTIYSLLAIASLCNQITAIVYATVASNKLTEITSAPATSVFALIQRDYELSWIATNVHFLFGLFGFLSMVGVRASVCFPSHLQKPAAGIALASLLGMCSVVNRGVQTGDGRGLVHGSSIVTLVWRYTVLLAKQVQTSGGIMAMAAIALGLVSTVLAVRAVMDTDDDAKGD